jgi:hypothetical protein
MRATLALIIRMQGGRNLLQAKRKRRRGPLPNAGVLATCSNDDKRAKVRSIGALRGASFECTEPSRGDPDESS